MLSEGEVVIEDSTHCGSGVRIDALFGFGLLAFISGYQFIWSDARTDHSHSDSKTYGRSDNGRPKQRQEEPHLLDPLWRLNGV